MPQHDPPRAEGPDGAERAPEIEGWRRPSVLITATGMLSSADASMSDDGKGAAAHAESPTDNTTNRRRICRIIMATLPCRRVRQSPSNCTFLGHGPIAWRPEYPGPEYPGPEYPGPEYPGREYPGREYPDRDGKDARRWG